MHVDVKPGGDTRARHGVFDPVGLKLLPDDIAPQPLRFETSRVSVASVMPQMSPVFPYFVSLFVSLFAKASPLFARLRR